jgi:hypothetical protein
MEAEHLLKRNSWRMRAAIILLEVTMAATFTGCVKPSQESPEPDIVSQVVSAMGTVKNYELDTVLTEDYTVIGQKITQYTDSWQWKGQILVDLANNKMKVSMEDFSEISNPIVASYVWEEYLVGGWLYYSQSSPVTNPPVANPWTKTKLTEQINWLWTDGTQIAPQIEMLKTATKVNLVGTEKVGDTNCYVLQLVPSPEAAADWVLSQNQGGSGPSTGWWRALVERSKEIYVKAYQDGSVRFWIDENSHRILQVDVSLHFDARPGNVLITDTGVMVTGHEDPTDVGFDQILRYFHGQLSFSDYGQAVSIVLPQDAVNAPTR